MPPPSSLSVSSNPAHPVVARLFLPDDANIAGHVHGGTILQLMEQAGIIAATRHCNSDRNSEYFGKQMAGLARFETMSFLTPAFVGDIGSATADVIFTSERSVLVKVVVTTENALKGIRRTTNTGLLWYTSFIIIAEKDHLLPKAYKQTAPVIVQVPLLSPPSTEEGNSALDEYNYGKSLYEARKKASSNDLSDQHNNQTDSNEESYCLQQKEGCLCPKCRTNYVYANDDDDDDSTKKTPSASHQQLSQMVLPGDCGTSNVAFGGFVMKLMDNAAGCCAFKHTHTNVVTVSMSAVNLLGIVYLGDIVTVDATMTFCSAKSMEISIVVSRTSMQKPDTEVVATGMLTFVSLDGNGKVLPVPTLVFENQEQLERGFEGQRKYVQARKGRAK